MCSNVAADVSTQETGNISHQMENENDVKNILPPLQLPATNPKEDTSAISDHHHRNARRGNLFWKNGG